MTARWKGLAAILTAAFVSLWPAAGAAQPVFFDDFDGDELLPHWVTPDPSEWKFSVSDSQLHVEDLFRPSVPKLSANNASIGAFFEPQMDFRMDVWMGWEREPAPRWDELVVEVHVGSAIMAQFGLAAPGAPPAIVAAAGAGGIFAPPPPPGIHQFTIARTGSVFDFYLDGDHFGSLPDMFGFPADAVVFFFSKPFPGEMNPKHIDRIRIVPAPGALIVAAVCVIACARRRR